VKSPARQGVVWQLRGESAEGNVFPLFPLAKDEVETQKRPRTPGERRLFPLFPVFPLEIEIRATPSFSSQALPIAHRTFPISQEPVGTVGTEPILLEISCSHRVFAGGNGGNSSARLGPSWAISPRSRRAAGCGGRFDSRSDRVAGRAADFDFRSLLAASPRAPSIQPPRCSMHKIALAASTKWSVLP
jgi:hypothetical protein